MGKIVANIAVGEDCAEYDKLPRDEVSRMWGSPHAEDINKLEEEVAAPSERSSSPTRCSDSNSPDDEGLSEPIGRQRSAESSSHSESASSHQEMAMKNTLTTPEAPKEQRAVVVRNTFIEAEADSLEEVLLMRRCVSEPAALNRHGPPDDQQASTRRCSDSEGQCGSCEGCCDDHQRDFKEPPAGQPSDGCYGRSDDDRGPSDFSSRCVSPPRPHGGMSPGSGSDSTADGFCFSSSDPSPGSSPRSHGHASADGDATPPRDRNGAARANRPAGMALGRAVDAGDAQLAQGLADLIGTKCAFLKVAGCSFHGRSSNHCIHNTSGVLVVFVRHLPLMRRRQWLFPLRQCVSAALEDAEGWEIRFWKGSMVASSKAPGREKEIFMVDFAPVPGGQ